MPEDEPGDRPPSSAEGAAHGDWATTRDLLDKIKEGDEEALNRLYTRYRPRLRAWASRRLPQWARDGRDTDDLVQDALTATLRTINVFELRFEGALHAYLRQTVHHRIQSLKTRAQKRPEQVEFPPDQVDPAPSQLDLTIGCEAQERYERALAELPLEARAAIVLKVELGYSYAQIAQLLDKPTDNAARMTVTRALFKLTKKMRRHGN